MSESTHRARIEEFKAAMGVRHVDDSRARIVRGVLRTPYGIEAVPVFCISCGTQHGYAMNLDNIICLCDDCFERYGGLPLPEVPEWAVRGKEKVG